MRTIKSILLPKEIDIAKISFIALDGCNRMSGENKGIKIKRIVYLNLHTVHNIVLINLY